MPISPPNCPTDPLGPQSLGKFSFGNFIPRSWRKGAPPLTNEEMRNATNRIKQFYMDRLAQVHRDIATTFTNNNFIDGLEDLTPPNAQLMYTTHYTKRLVDIDNDIKLLAEKLPAFVVEALLTRIRQDAVRTFEQYFQLTVQQAIESIPRIETRHRCQNNAVALAAILRADFNTSFSVLDTINSKVTRLRILSKIKPPPLKGSSRLSKLGCFGKWVKKGFKALDLLLPAIVIWRLSEAQSFADVGNIVNSAVEELTFGLSSTGSTYSAETAYQINRRIQEIASACAWEGLSREDFISRAQAACEEYGVDLDQWSYEQRLNIWALAGGPASNNPQPTLNTPGTELNHIWDLVSARVGETEEFRQAIDLVNAANQTLSQDLDSKIDSLLGKDLDICNTSDINSRMEEVRRYIESKTRETQASLEQYGIQVATMSADGLVDGLGDVSEFTESVSVGYNGADNGPEPKCLSCCPRKDPCELLFFYLKEGSFESSVVSACGANPPLGKRGEFQVLRSGYLYISPYAPTENSYYYYAQSPEFGFVWSSNFPDPNWKPMKYAGLDYENRDPINDHIGLVGNDVSNPWYGAHPYWFVLECRDASSTCGPCSQSSATWDTNMKQFRRWRLLFVDSNYNFQNVDPSDYGYFIGSNGEPLPSSYTLESGEDAGCSAPGAPAFPPGYTFVNDVSNINLKDILTPESVVWYAPTPSPDPITSSLNGKADFYLQSLDGQDLFFRSCPYCPTWGSNGLYWAYWLLVDPTPLEIQTPTSKPYQYAIPGVAEPGPNVVRYVWRVSVGQGRYPNEPGQEPVIQPTSAPNICRNSDGSLLASSALCYVDISLCARPPAGTTIFANVVVDDSYDFSAHFKSATPTYTSCEELPDEGCTCFGTQLSGITTESGITFAVTVL